MYSMVVTVDEETDAKLGKMKACLKYYFENPVDATEFYQRMVELYQRLESQQKVAHINIYATDDEEQA